MISAGAEGMSKVSAALGSSASGVSLDSLKMAPVIHNPEKIICIGLNYSDHCTEQNLTPPKEPVVFNKFPSTLVGHGDAIQLPKIGCNTGTLKTPSIINSLTFSRSWGGTSHYHWQRRPSHFKRIRFRPRLRIHHRQRRVWSGLAKETQRRSMASRQNFWYFLPAWPRGCYWRWSIEFEDFVSTKRCFQELIKM